MTTSESRATTFAELGLRCEVCGGAATCLVQDFIRKYKPSILFVDLERDGEIHIFCATHQRASKVREHFE